MKMMKEIWDINIGLHDTLCVCMCVCVRVCIVYVYD